MWRRTLGLLVWLLLVLLLQSTLVPLLGAYLGQLDLFLALVCAVALYHGPESGAGFGLAAGLLRDVTLGFGLGFYALPLFMIGYGVGHLSRVVFRESIVVPFLAGLAGAVTEWLLLVLLNGFLYEHWIAGRFLTQLFAFLLVNSLLVPVVYAAYTSRRDRQVLPNRRESSSGRQ